MNMPRGWFAYNHTGSDLAAGSYNYVDYNWECIGTAQICVIYAYYVGTPTPLTTPVSPLEPFIQQIIVSSRTVSSNAVPQIGKPYLYKITF
ncbi:hypothetical protein SAMN06265348_11793 [Pedobacter westerhofensis]|uniref:Uncharacterized protein n=1 Tax=Pedobacter westerhofensis TaxID=425512 RepID=A0A521FRK9_9SPHI|nr:hypothetical protein SAMN06265348_11793 [Pedobacter westerhofensis]